MELEERLLRLEKVLSTLSDHEGWVIGKCRFELGVPEDLHDPDESCTMKILKENRNLAEIRIECPGSGTLDVMLMKPVEKRFRTPVGERLADTGSGMPDGTKREETGRNAPVREHDAADSEKNVRETEQTSEKTGEDLWRKETFQITRAETDRYLERSNDKNPIHRGNDAIVPGFLMANRIAVLFQKPERIQARFLAPLPVGKEARLTVRKKTEREYLAEADTEEAKILKMNIWEAE